MNHEERYAVVVIFNITLVSIGAVTFMLLNSKSSEPKQYFYPNFLTGSAINNYCKDSDEGINPGVRGIATNLRSQAIDRCTSIGVIEYSCDPIGGVVADHIPCPKGCYEGACMKSALVAYAFNPFLKSRLKKLVN